MVDASGENERRLTFERRNVWGGAWRSDGRELVVASNRTGRPGLWSVDVTRGTMRWLGVQSPAAVFPSIAGNRLAFLEIDTDVNLWRVPLKGEGSPEPFAVSTHWDLHPAISPGGTQVAFVSNRSGSYEVWVADSGGGSLRRVTDFGGPFTSTPRWSPDGNSLVFAGRPDGNADVFLLKLNSAGPRPITADVADDLAPEWSAAGDSILFTSNRSGAWETWEVGLEGGRAKQVTHVGSFGARPIGDRGEIGFSSSSETGLWRLAPQSGREIELIGGMDPRDWGSWRIVGSHLYYLHRDVSTQVLRYDMRSAEVDTLFEAPEPVPVMDPALDVSPDESWLLIGQVDREEADIMAVELK